MKHSDFLRQKNYSTPQKWLLSFQGSCTLQNIEHTNIGKINPRLRFPWCGRNCSEIASQGTSSFHSVILWQYCLLSHLGFFNAYFNRVVVNMNKTNKCSFCGKKNGKVLYRSQFLIIFMFEKNDFQQFAKVIIGGNKSYCEVIVYD